MVFAFHHGSILFGTTCGCLIQARPGTVTYDVPANLAEHGIQLVKELGLETKYASVVVMKLFLGLYVPASLRGSFPDGKRQAEPSTRDGEPVSAMPSSFVGIAEEDAPIDRVQESESADKEH